MRERVPRAAQGQAAQRVMKRDKGEGVATEEADWPHFILCYGDLGRKEFG